MAAPNIVNVGFITGITTFTAGISTVSVGTTILSNPASSNQVYKLNTLLVANTSGASNNITVKIFNSATPTSAGSSVSIASNITIPTGSSLSVIGKDTPLYIEENRSICAIGSTISMDIVASYEIIG